MKIEDLVALSSDERFRFYSRVDTETRLLNDQSLAALEAAIRYLFVTNAGGAVAVLSYLATAKRVSRAVGPLVALVCFFIGVVLVGVLHCYRTAYFGRRWRAWWQGIGGFFAGTTTWEEVNTQLGTASREHQWPYVVGYLSGLFFVAGAVVGFVLLVCAG